MRRNASTLRIAAAAALMTLFATAPTNGTEVLRKELDRIAEQMQQALKQQNQPSIAIGEIAGPAQLDTNFGPGVSAGLAQALKLRGITVSRKASLSVRGRYAKVPSDRYAGQSMVRLTVELFDQDDQPRGSYQARFYDSPTIAAFLGVTASLPPDGDLHTRNLEVVDAAERPSAVIDGTRLRASSSSPFAVEVLVSAGPGQPAAPRTPTISDGQAVVDVCRGELYAIRVYNQANFEAAAIITVDGLSVFTFSEIRANDGSSLYFFYPVAAGTMLDVVGWFRGMGRSDAFQVTEYGHGAAALVRNPPAGKTGVITVQFAACAQPGAATCRRAHRRS